MAIAYQYNQNGYFVGAEEDHGLLPNNATYLAPEQKEGFIARWAGQAWENIENHVGLEGFVNGEAFTIKDYGALPEGWSDTPPTPTLESAKQQKLAQINGAYDNAIDYIQADYPLKEILSWDIQYAQSKELLENPEAAAIFVRELAEQRGLSVEEMRDRILANAESWQRTAGFLTAQRQIMKEAVLLAQKIEDVEDISIDFDLGKR